MSSSNDTSEVGRLLDLWAKARQPLVSVDPPTSMRVGDLDADGWGAWRMIPSTVSPEDIGRLEARLGVALPPFYRAFLLCRCVLDLDFGDYELPALHPSAPLRLVERKLFSGYASGFVEFASARGCGDPVCFDLSRQGPDGDYRVVVFNHDVVPENVRRDPRALGPYAGVIAPSFRVFFTQLLSGDAAVFPPPESEEDIRRRAAWEQVYELLRARGLPAHYRPTGIDVSDPWAIAKLLRAG